MPELPALLPPSLTVGESFQLVISDTESRADYYREQGRQIRALVNLVISPDVKQELLELAEQFERLAVQADHAVQS
ncbi:MAG TPA: hypothetical protein VG328_12495 [Stellaceae bacterium]|jgi:uncharacterized protein Yka (UPF0111/DUF47 family)|nr:hypothetical protein [Stellaceae bacterium]